MIHHWVLLSVGFPWSKTLFIWSLDSVLKAEMQPTKCTEFDKLKC